MANGYFERGEVYWVRMDNGFGGEQGVGRPGVVLTENSVNAKCSTVTIAFMSTKHHASNPFYLPVEATGITSYVVLNQIMTYDKTRIGKYMGMLNSAEQKAVDDALEDLFDLGYVDDAALKEKESEIVGLNLLISEAKAEVAGVRAEVEKRDNEIAALKMEIEMWQKCYGRCMDMLVDTKVNGDLSRRTAVREPKVGTAAAMIPDLRPEPPKQPEPPKEPVEESEPERLDINSCTATALKKIGFSLAMARKIVESRPFKSVEDLKRVNGLKGSHYRVMEPKLCCVPVKVEEPVVTPKVEEPVVEREVDPGFERVNINTASYLDIHEVTGLCKTTCSCIVGYRKKNGLYTEVNDLLKVANIYPGTLARIGHLLEV